MSNLEPCTPFPRNLLGDNFCSTGADSETSGEAMQLGSQGQRVLPNVSQIVLNTARVSVESVFCSPLRK